MITTIFCSCHDNCVVVTFAKICNGQSHRKWNTTERIWIWNEKSSIRWLPDYVSNVTGALTDFCLFWWRLWNCIPYHDCVTYHDYSHTVLISLVWWVKASQSWKENPLCHPVLPVHKTWGTQFQPLWCIPITTLSASLVHGAVKSTVRWLVVSDDHNMWQFLNISISLTHTHTSLDWRENSCSLLPTILPV